MLLRPAVNVQRAAFGADVMRPAVEGGRIKVTDHLIWVNVVAPDGVPRRLSATKGESLLHVLQRHKVPGIHPDCDGGDKENQMLPYQIPFDWYSMGVSCGMCSVHIPDPYFDKLNKSPQVEQDKLIRRGMPNSQYSRLACCIQMRPELNEMIVVVGNNRSVEGEWFSSNDIDQF